MCGGGLLAKARYVQEKQKQRSEIRSLSYLDDRDEAGGEVEAGAADRRLGGFDVDVDLDLAAAAAAGSRDAVSLSGTDLGREFAVGLLDAISYAIRQLVLSRLVRCRMSRGVFLVMEGARKRSLCTLVGIDRLVGRSIGRPVIGRTRCDVRAGRLSVCNVGLMAVQATAVQDGIKRDTRSRP